MQKKRKPRVPCGEPGRRSCRRCTTETAWADGGSWLCVLLSWLVGIRRKRGPNGSGAAAQETQTEPLYDVRSPQNRIHAGSGVKGTLVRCRSRRCSASVALMRGAVAQRPLGACRRGPGGTERVIAAPAPPPSKSIIP